MQKLPTELKRYLAFLLPPVTFFSLRSVDRAFWKALSNFNDYFRPKVEQLSTFTPIPFSPSLTTYEEIFIAITTLNSYSKDFSIVTKRSELTAKLVLQTPILLKKLMSDDDALGDIMVLILYFPSLTDLLMKNTELIELCMNTHGSWPIFFIQALDKHPQVYNSFIKNEGMIMALTRHLSWHMYEHLKLCKILQDKYNAEQRYIDAVLATYGEYPPDTYSLFKSLKPYAKAMPIDAERSKVVKYNSPPHLVNSPRLTHLLSQQQNNQPDQRPAKNKRPLPPPPTQKPDKPKIEVQAKRSLTPPPLQPQNLNLSPKLTRLRADPRFTTTMTNNPLHLAVLNSETGLVKHFMKNKTLNCANKSGDYPIHIAVRVGNEGVVKLLASEPNMLAPLNKEGVSAFQLAYQLNNSRLTQLLGESQQNIAVDSTNYQP